MVGEGALGALGPSRRAVLLGGGGLLALGACGAATVALAARLRAAPVPRIEAVPAAQVRPWLVDAPARGIDLHPASRTTLQSLHPLPATGEWFTTQADPGTSGLVDPGGLAVGDIVISRLAADGTLLDAMTLPDSGHGMSIVVRLEEGARVVYSCWFAPDGSGRRYDVVRLRYAPGIARRADATAVVPGAGYPLDPALDVSTGAVTLRHQGGGGPEYTRHTWADFAAGDLSRPTGAIATADWPPTHQGFASRGDRFFFATGAASDLVGRDPAVLTEYSWRTGRVVGRPIDASGNARGPDGSYPGGRMEPEGATVVTDRSGAAALVVGVVTGGTGPDVPRAFRTYRYPLAPS